MRSNFRDDCTRFLIALVILALSLAAAFGWIWGFQLQ